MREKFVGISEVKFKEGIFIGPQIPELLKNENFETIHSSKENRAFKNISSNFLGNKKIENYKNLVEELSISQDIRLHHVIETVYFLHTQLKIFPDQQIAQMDPNIVGLCFWKLETEQAKKDIKTLFNIK